MTGFVKTFSQEGCSIHSPLERTRHISSCCTSTELKVPYDSEVKSAGASAVAPRAGSRGVCAVVASTAVAELPVLFSGCVSSSKKYAMTTESTSKEEQMRLGRRYGNFAKRPVGLNRDGKFSLGCENIPPIEAISSVLT